MSARTDALSYRGAKHTCANAECGRRFYDLKKLPTPCPYCGTLFVPPKVVPASSLAGAKLARYRPQPVTLAAPEPLPPVEIEQDEPEASDDEEDLPLEEDDEPLEPGHEK